MAGKLRKTNAARPPLRRELAEIGLDLVEEQGFEALSFATLAERAGVDEAQVRTQFHTVYDIVFAQSRGQLEWLSAALVDRVPDEHFPTVLDRISSEYIQAYEADGEYHKRRIRLIEADPQLRRWASQVDDAAIQRVLEIMVHRGDSPALRIKATMHASSWMAGIRAALKEWAFAEGDTSAVELFQAASALSVPLRSVPDEIGHSAETIDLRARTSAS